MIVFEINDVTVEGMYISKSEFGNEVRNRVLKEKHIPKSEFGNELQ